MLKDLVAAIKMDFSYSSTDQWLSGMEEQLDPTTFMITPQDFSAALVPEEDFSNSFSSTCSTNPCFFSSAPENIPKKPVECFFSQAPSNSLISFGNNLNTSALNIDKTHLFYNANNLASIFVKPKEEEASLLGCNSTNAGTDNSHGNKTQQVYAFKGSAIHGSATSSSNNIKENTPTITSSTNTMSTKPLSFSQEHVIAERKRRERLNQHFIALSALVPGLKKMDKATVLGDATKYLKELQERVKTLDDKEQTTKSSKMESVIFVKKSQLLINDDDEDGNDGTSSCKESLLTSNTDGSCYEDSSLPEIEATDSNNKTISIRIHCKKRKGVLVKILEEIEKLHLTVVHSSVMPFGDYALYITAIAQMDAEYCSTMRNLVKNLRLACRDHQ